MIKLLQTWFRSLAHSDLTQSTVDLSPYGTLLVLRCPPGVTKLRAGAVSDRLRDYSDGSMPYVGILIDFAGCEYRFSSSDLGGLLSYIAAWVRGWVAPCAVVLPTTSAGDLQRLLELVKVDTIKEIRVVTDMDLGLAHIREVLDRRGPTRA